MSENDTNTALAPVENTALTPAQKAFAAKEELAKNLPTGVAERIMTIDRPTGVEMARIVANLPDSAQEGLKALIKKANPQKAGLMTQATGFTPVELRVNHGVGADPLKPSKLPSGEFYSTESKQVEQPLRAAVLFVYEGRIMWPARDNGTPAAPASDPQANTKQPICVSMDRQVGSRYGECASCAFADKPYNQGGCDKEIVAFLIDDKYENIYRLAFSKSSGPAGNALVKMLKQSGELWERFFEFKLVERTKGDKKWYVIAVSPVNDPKNPKAAFTDKAMHPLFEALSNTILFDVYAPGLKRIYTKEHEQAGGGENFDESKLMSDANAPSAAPKGDNPNFDGEV